MREGWKKVVFAIQSLCATEYFNILWRKLHKFGFKFDNEYLVCDINEGGFATCHEVEMASLDQAELWFELDEQQLIDFAYDNRKSVDVKIVTSNPERVPLSLQLLALRLFQKSFNKKFPISDREELIYPALFDYKDPDLLWESAGGVRALCYPGGYEGLDVYVSSGFSNPEMKPAALKSEDYKIMGYGYELILFAKPEAKYLRDIFIYAVQNICETKHHIMRDHWVKFEEGFPLETGGLAGLVCVTPTWVPEYFPLQNGVVYWNLLVGVGAEELAIAENQGVEASLIEKWDAEERGDATQE